MGEVGICVNECTNETILWLTVAHTDDQPTVVQHGRILRDGFLQEFLGNYSEISS
jgi:hypothetical protein